MATAIIDENEINYFEEARENLFKRSILLSEIWPVPTIMACYLMFIFFGNRIMEKRDPFHLKLPMLVYNIFQICYNFHMFYRCIQPPMLIYVIGHMCHPMDPAKNELYIEGFELTFLFFASKLVDLTDTVFLVLRKKVKQISFLHLYHHISMAVVFWGTIKYFTVNGEQIYLVYLFNSLVHVIMYVYYFLSLLGPSLRKYLWWKKYITMIQLAQFMIYIVDAVAVMAYGCTQPYDISIILFLQALVFFALFGNFYKKHYKNFSSAKSTAELENKKKL